MGGKTTNTTKAKPKKKTHPWQPKFLAALKKTGNICKSAKAAGVDRGTVYDWRDADEANAEAMTEAISHAKEDSTDALEAEAERRAKKASDVLLIFLLKSRKPDVYREVHRHEHSGPGGGAITHEQRITFAEFERLPLEDRVRILRAQVLLPGGDRNGRTVPPGNERVPG
jgi:hypothetical protein